jgi:DNA polymerase
MYVKGEGNPNATLMIIGEAPGYREQSKGYPFIGKSGAYLKDILFNEGYNMDDIYYTNIVKCRPSMNRTPTPFEVSKCKPHLFREITKVRPKVILCLGMTATSLFLNNVTTMASAISKHCRVGDTLVLFGYHPSYILRNEELRAKYQEYFYIIKQLIPIRK